MNAQRSTLTHRSSDPAPRPGIQHTPSLPWSSVRETMYAGEFGSRPLRYVACRCPKCDQRNRVVVHTGGGAMSWVDVKREYPRVAHLLGKSVGGQDYYWTAGRILGEPIVLLSHDGEVIRGTGVSPAICGACFTKWSISMHANGPFGPRRVPTPLRDDGPQTDPPAFY